MVVTHPLKPHDNLDLYRQMGREFDREAEAEALCEKFEATLAGSRSARSKKSST